MVVLKRILTGLLSLLSWLWLLIAVVATSATLMLSGLGHTENLASTILQDFLKDQNTMNSLIDEFKKDVDPQIAKQIEKNRDSISQTIESLVASAEFQDALSKPLNQIAQGILAGSATVKVDFSQITTLIAEKVNTAAKSKIFSKKDLAELQSRVLNIEEQSKIYAQVHSNLRTAMLLWVAWVLLLVALFYLKGRAVLKTAGRQLLSIGVLILILKFGTPFVAGLIIKSSSGSSLLIDILPKVIGSVTTPMFNLAIVVLLIGTALLGTEIYLRRREANRDLLI